MAHSVNPYGGSQHDRSSSSSSTPHLSFPNLSSQKFFSCADIDLPVKIKVLSLDGQANFRDYYVSAQLWADDRKIGPSVNTGFGKVATMHQYNWNSVLTFAAKYQALPVSTQVTFTIWDISSPQEHIPFGGTTISLFSRRHILRKGRQKLHIWQGKVGDGSSLSETPGKLYRANELDEIEKLIKKWNRGRIKHVGWLDKLASRAIEKINMQTDTGPRNSISLFIELPEFEYPVVFSTEIPSLLPNQHQNNQNTQKNPVPKSGRQYQSLNSASARNYNSPSLQQQQLLQANFNQYSTLYSVDYDPDVLAQTPAEKKHNTQTRARKRSPLDAAQRNLKPNSNDRQLLATIVSYPPTKSLTESEMEKIWNFRFYLRSNKKALTKFVRSVEWTQKWQIEEASLLMNQWETIDIDDALELLSKSFVRYPGVRAFAVHRFEAASDDEVCTFLMQLVQALRYDKLVHPAVSTNGTTANNNNTNSNNTTTSAAHSSLSELASFLINRAVLNDVIGTYFYWYLKVETLAPPGSTTASDVDFYHKILKEFLTAMEEDGRKEKCLENYQRQEKLVDTCAKICSSLKVSRLPRVKKIEKLRDTLKEGGENASLLEFEPMPLPLDPASNFHGVHSDVSIFNSAMNPIRLNLKMIPDKPLSVMFKMGDDLRQDQLVVQLISLMDNLLKKENLDLKLTPYKVLATSRSLGMIELVPNSTNIADVLKKYEGDLLKYLKHYNPADSQPSTTATSPSSQKLHEEWDTYGVAPVALNNFVRSCAGYCVITYLLGIGDRHLDNLLITHDGKLFHIDFGFIMGRDPKPFPPPMKLCKEMVFGMGGHDSPHYVQFKSFACEAYNILRKSGNLILNLCSLMVDSNLEDIDGMRSIMKIQEKLKLDLTDEEATQHLQNLITESVRAIMPSLMEKVHQWAKYWRN